MSFFVYILKMGPPVRYYVGQTNDISRRLKEHREHKHGGKAFSARYNNIQIAWLKRVPTRAAALDLEEYLKRYRRLVYALVDDPRRGTRGARPERVDEFLAENGHVGAAT